MDSVVYVLVKQLISVLLITIIIELSLKGSRKKGKYFKKPVKDCEFADRQHNLKGCKLILIFGRRLKQNIF